MAAGGASQSVDPAVLREQKERLLAFFTAAKGELRARMQSAFRANLMRRRRFGTARGTDVTRTRFIWM